MFYIREILFHFIVDAFRHLVGVSQRLFPVNLNFEVDINLVAEHSGADRVHTDYAILPGDVFFHFFIISFAAGSVQQLNHAIFQNIVRCFHNKQTDNYAGYGVHHGKAQHSACDTDERADGGKGVRAMVPGVCQKRRGVDELSIDTENIYIEGDNIDALKLLQETYLGKVKLIYIEMMIC